MDFVPRGHVLIWTADATLAGRLERSLEAHGFASGWAAALHEAVAYAARFFPRAVACRMRGETPSWLDLETLHTYERLGSSFVSLPPTPVWALCENVLRWSEEAAGAGIDVHLLDERAGPDELARAIAGAGCETLERRPPAAGEPCDVLLVDEDEAGGECCARYFGSRGIWCRHAADSVSARHALAKRDARAVICNIPDGDDGGSILRDVAAAAPRIPLIIMTARASNAGRMRRRMFPPNVAGIFIKPVDIHELEASLRRLLRLPRSGREPVTPAQR